VGVLLGSILLEGTTVAEAVPELILNYDYLQNIEKFFGKADFVAEQFALQVLGTIDVNNSTFLAFYGVLSAFIFIKIETEKIKFYNIQKIVSIVFAMILISSVVITPFSYTVLYWGNAFAQEDTVGDGIGSTDESLVDQIVETVEEIVPEPPPVEPELPIELPTELPVEEPIEQTIKNSTETTIDEPIQNTIPTVGNNLTELFDENLVQTDDGSQQLEQYTYKQSTNQTISFDETFNLIDNSILSLDNYSEIPIIGINQTISLNEILSLMDNIEPFDIPQNYSETLLEDLSFLDEALLKLNGTTQNNLHDRIIILDDLSLQLNNQTTLPISPPKTEDMSDKLFTN